VNVLELGKNLIENGDGEWSNNGNCDTATCPKKWHCNEPIKTISYNQRSVGTPNSR